MNHDQSSKDHEHRKAAPPKSRRLAMQPHQFSRKRLQETEAREFWNRRAQGSPDPDRKAA